MKKKDIIKICICIAIGVFIVFAINNNLEIKYYEVNANKKLDEEILIVLITDLHNTLYGKKQEILIKEVKSLKPDLILLGGDIVDENSLIEASLYLFEGIRKICPIFYVSGNHEFWTFEIEKVKEIIRSYDILVLEDEYINIKINDTNILLAGVDDPDKKNYQDFSYNQKKSMKQNFSNIANVDSEYNILLAHRPEEIKEYLKYDFDLVLSGHAHGGQIRIPYVLDGLYSPNQGLFPKYPGGEYRYNNLTHIVSRGLSFNANLPRIFNKPEIVVIELK